MSKKLVPDAEDVLRAVMTNDYDGERISSSLFKGKDTSLSRPAIISTEEHWILFRRIENPPKSRFLKAMLRIGVGELRSIGRQHSEPRELTVVEDPLDWNPAHAVIPESISRGLANKIKDACTLLELPKP